MKTFELPDLGEGLMDAEIVSWHVSEGDHVVTDQPLVSVETDKAVVEVPSPYSGRIAKLFGKPGERIEVEATLVEFEDGKGADNGTVVGEISAEGAAKAPRETVAGAGAKVRAAPAVRALAGKLGVDLDMVQPTGPGGAVTQGDVERIAKMLAQAGPAEPLKGARRAMAERMTRAHAQVVPATVYDEADAGAIKTGAVTLRLIRAIAAGCAAGCAAEPALNAWYNGKQGTRRLNRKVDLGIAADTKDALFVPVLKDVGNRNAAGLDKELERMKADVKARKVAPKELRGQTITLSNFGTMAGRHAALVVVPPQVAILGAGRITNRVVARQGKPRVRPVLPLSLTFDHRAVTGGEAARFLSAVIKDLEAAQ